jgi:uncharacterized protein with FMN-binding domain
MKKYLLGAGLVIVFAGYAIYQYVGGTKTTAVVTPSTTGNDSSDQTASTGTFKDGEYTGVVADAYYGKMQVKAIIQGGKIVDIQNLQYPNSPGHTTEVSNSALPKLKTEAIAIQSSQVSNVSGATQTADGYRITLESALAQARS